jgi:hypothetical protein
MSRFMALWSPQAARLAVTTVSRSPALPNIATLGEFLPGLEAN